MESKMNTLEKEILLAATAESYNLHDLHQRIETLKNTIRSYMALQNPDLDFLKTAQYHFEVLCRITNLHDRFIQDIESFIKKYVDQ